MESIKEDAPAPALTRGLRVLALLAQDGSQSLERLSGRTGLPKSSVLRYLQALERDGIVVQDEASRLWLARQALQPLPDVEEERIRKTRQALPLLAEQLGYCVELYLVRGSRVELVERSEPWTAVVSVQARIGYVRDLNELDATSLIYRAFSGMPSSITRDCWYWAQGRETPVPVKLAERAVADAFRTGIAVDYDFNVNGIRRIAVPLLDENRLLSGILAVAQHQTPLSQNQLPQIKTTLLKYSSS